MRHSRLLLVVLLGLGLAAAVSAQPAKPKLVILGFDGADAKLATRWMDEGKLPNLAKLRAEGSFAPLLPTIPSQTPVSWSTFSTGLNPGRHGVFDFLKRDPSNYKPTFAAAAELRVPFLWGPNNGWVIGGMAGVLAAILVFLIMRPFHFRAVISLIVALIAGVGAGAAMGTGADRLLPQERPTAVNSQRGETFWQTLAKNGTRVRVIRIPVTFPPKAFPQGELLSGLGVPDLSKRIGKPFYFTSELFFTPKGGGDFKVEVTQLVDNKGTIDTEIKGPPNELFPKPGTGPGSLAEPDLIKIPMRLTVAPDRSALRIQVSGNDVTLKPGQWSDFVRFTFPFNSVIKVRGIGKFRLMALTPEIKLYLSPVQFDPEHLPYGLELTTPASFIGDLTRRFGLFKTIGWSIDTWSMTDGTSDEQGFLEDLDQTVAKEQEILKGSLADTSWDVLIHYFEFTDRVQHMMFRFIDPKHPLYTAEGAAKWGGSILLEYQRMDQIVGDTMRQLPQGARLIVLSDHGFTSFRRGMNYNTWFVKNGFMTLNGEEAHRKNLEDLFGQGNFFVNVDWSKTQAYALGLGQIYLNVAGREAKGIVQPGKEYERLASAIREGLQNYVDPETGEHPVAHVFTRDEAYGTYDPLLIPDLIPGNSEGYRVGWQDTLGGVGTSITEPNDQIWSGDHCSVYPPLVKGILFANYKLNTSDPKMGDMAATILDLYGVQPAEKLDGVSLNLKKP
jgi:predicted AlkP superfamily phosphohydrolase/phosphomutase